MRFFDLTGEQVARLGDADLRLLIAKLCAAELRRAGYQTSYLTAGGNQDAPDEGIDVRVDLPNGLTISGYIPRSATGFQVKVPDMPPKAILDEMAPNGILRSTIEELGRASGAYVIVSSHGSVADAALRRRREAMCGAIASSTQCANLFVDFYDRDRLANWVLQHPGIVQWVKERIGEPTCGWHPYGNWANPTETPDAAYLLDEKARVFYGAPSTESGLSVLEGIDRIREVLARPHGVVRLVGLSGLGKTRLVQAIFDARIGSGALDPALCVYTNLGTEPDPTARDVLNGFVANRERALVVIDNCPPDAHRDFAAVVQAKDSLVSLITVEYDVADDEPEWTEVFRLEPASDETIDRLLGLMVPHISQVDRRQITEVSGGNARIALAIARTIGPDESIAAVRDEDLFKRLFFQRQDPSDDLLRAAEVCSLFYSFDGVSTDSQSELRVIATLASQSVDEVYRAVSKLRSLDLVQARGVWRAVLPHALAVRLARQALDGTPQTKLLTEIERNAPARLLTSFARRLGYMHDSMPARQIVSAWTDEAGFLCPARILEAGRLQLLKLVAPVSPERVIAVLERAYELDQERFVRIGFVDRSSLISLLKSLSYDSDLFPRAAILLARMRAAEPRDTRSQNAFHAFSELFQVVLSGTHAPVEVRLAVVDVMLTSEAAADRGVGLEALSAMLKSAHFSSSSTFQFGSRSRNFGWHPGNKAALLHWYRQVLIYAESKAMVGDESALAVRAMLARSLCSLWKKGLDSELEDVVSSISQKAFWGEAWVAVRNCLSNEKEQLEPSKFARLQALESKLRPRSLIEKTLAYVFSKQWSDLDIADGEQSDGTLTRRIATADEITFTLGQEVAQDEEVLKIALPAVVSGDVGRGWPFGAGLAKGATSCASLWAQLIEVVGQIPERQRNIRVLQGFISGVQERDPQTAGALLDSAIFDPVLGSHFPILQSSVTAGIEGGRRLERSISVGVAPSWTYRHLAWGRSADSIPSEMLERIVLGLGSLADGFDVAVEVLAMRLHSAHADESSIDENLKRCGRQLLMKCTFDDPGNMRDYHLARLIEEAFEGEAGEAAADEVCRLLAKSLGDYRTYAYAYEETIKALFRSHPRSALNRFIGDRTLDEMTDVIQLFDLERSNPVSEVPLADILEWAMQDSARRFEKLSAAIDPFQPGEVTGSLKLSPVARLLIEHAPDRLKTLRQLASHLDPRSWSGSLADHLESRASALLELTGDADSAVAEWAQDLLKRTKERIVRERAMESQRHATFE